MWPFSKKPQTSHTDPHWDYTDPEQFMRGPRFAQLTEDERDAVQRGLLAFQGQRLHPEIAESTFSAFTAAAIANYALDVARNAPEEPALFAAAIAALKHAHSFYSHPVLMSHLADVFEAARQSQDAEQARTEGSRQQARWTPRDTDPLLLSSLRRF